MIDYVIFDLDGTLVDSAAICAEIVNEMHGERNSGQTVSYDVARAYASVGGEKMIAAMLGAACGEPSIEIADFRARYAVRPTPLHSLFAGVREGLAELHAQGFKLAICSNKPQNLCEKVLAEFGLRDQFDVVIGGAPGRTAKPDPHLLDLAMEKLGAAPHQCCFVGDSEIDHAIAATRNLPFLFVNYGYAADGWDDPHMARFDHFEEVTRAVLAMRSIDPWSLQAAE